MRLVLFIAFLGLGTLCAQTSFEEKVTNASNVRIAVTNAGTFGNAFRGYRDGTANASCEYPAGSGVEHLFEGGIWFGGLLDGTQTLVTTSAYDQPQGYATGRAGFEFTGEVGSRLNERSTLFDNPNFSPFAVSHQDYVATMTDTNLFVPGTMTPIASHTQPLNIQVNLKTYNWNFSFSDFLVFVDMEIINLGRPGTSNLIDSAYFGLWSNTVVRNINVTPAGSGGSAFYNKGGNGYSDSLYMAYCYDYSGDVGFTNSYIGIKFLGAEDKFGFHHPTLDSSFKPHYNAWQFNTAADPVYFLPTNDNQRYIKMTRGLNDDPCWTIDNNCGGGTYQEQLNTAGNRSDLTSIGPFRDFGAGDTIKVSYAFVLAPKLDDGNAYTANTIAQRAQFTEHAERAQTAYNGEDVNFNGILDEGEDRDQNGIITRFILPAPPDIPRTRVEVSDSKVEIYWSDNGEFTVDPITQTRDFEGYRVYLTKLGFDVTGVPNLLEDLVPIAEYDLPDNRIFKDIGLGAIRLEEPVTFDGDTVTYYYRYTIENLSNGWQYAVAVSAFDTGNPESNLESLESSLLANNFRIFTGTTANEDIDKNAPFAYPDPYYSGAAWEGVSNFQEQSRKLVFANLPKRCFIRIFSPAGDLIDEIFHDENYRGDDIRWYQTFAAENAEDNQFAGGEHAWDLLSADTQIISRGLYLFVVEDMDTGETKKGKFTIIK